MLYQPAIHLPAVLPAFHMMVVTRLSRAAEPRLIQLVIRHGRESILEEQRAYVQRRTSRGWEVSPCGENHVICTRIDIDAPQNSEVLLVTVGDSTDPASVWDIPAALVEPG